MKDPLKLYPWLSTAPGESFFVPTLNVLQTLYDGLQTASRVGLSTGSVRADPAVYRGVLGVMFRVRARGSASVPEPPPA